MTKEVFLKQIGENITKIRKEKGLSQSKLALRIGQNRHNMNRLEKGGQNPSIYMLQEIAEVLKIPVKDLLDFD